MQRQQKQKSRSRTRSIGKASAQRRKPPTGRKGRLQDGRGGLWSRACALSEVHEDLAELNSKNVNHLIYQRAEDLNTRFSEEDTQMADGRVEGSSASLGVPGVRFRTPGRRHLAPVSTGVTQQD